GRPRGFLFDTGLTRDEAGTLFAVKTTRLRDVAFDLALLDAGGLALQLAHVEQAGATDLAEAAHLDAGEAGRLERENALDGDAVRNLADGEGGRDTRAATLDDDAGEGLDALLVAFDDLEVDADGVAGAELGQVGAAGAGVNEGDFGMHGDFLLCACGAGGAAA